MDKDKVIRRINVAIDELYDIRKMVEELTDVQHEVYPTRKSEFLKIFPNADVGEIYPCALNSDLARDCKDFCIGLGCEDCRKRYWKEVANE